jgi:transcriptional regulator with XRE-family HTH domain
MAQRARAKNQRHRDKPDPLAKIVGARVRSLRREKAWTFDAFVEETGLGRGYISELERGLVVPTITTLARVADALEVTMADLVLGGSSRERVFDLSRDLEEKEVAAILKRVEALVGDRAGKK